jgi:hypothetical protein
MRRTAILNQLSLWGVCRMRAKRKTRCRSRDGWASRPRRLRHPILGGRQVWWRADRRARVDRFLAGSGRFIALVQDEESDRLYLVHDYPTLARAQAACERVAAADDRMKAIAGLRRGD